MNEGGAQSRGEQDTLDFTPLFHTKEGLMDGLLSVSRERDRLAENEVRP